jgi:hypothetical protein
VKRWAALAAAAALAGCGGGGGHDHGRSPARGTMSPRPPSAQEELKALLSRRARALQDGDVKAYAATAIGAQRTADRRAARNARGLPLRAVRLTAQHIDLHGRSAVLQARSGYALAGVQGRFDAERMMRAVRTADGWRIRSETSRRRRHPWEVAPFTAQRSRHFLILAPYGLDDSGLTDALEAGYARIKTILAAGRLRRRYAVVVAADAREARQMTSGIRGVATLAAISDTAVREEGAAERVARISSQRLLVVWSAFAPLDPDGRQRVVAHELTHAALADVTSGRTPSWLLEGIALYVSGDRRVAEAAQLVGAEALGGGAPRRALTLTGLSDPDAIARLGGDAQTAAYAYASSAAFYIVARYGRRRFLDLYDVFNQDSLPGRPGPTLVDRALRRVLHVPLLKLERNLRDWIVTRAVVAPEAP